MGGTFDPIHNGHLLCAEEARTQFQLDEVVFIPAGHPWQKEAVTSAEDRYLLTVLATAPNPYFSVSRMEIDRAGPTYTVDTLNLLRNFYRDGIELFFIVGTDAVADILSWKDPETVLEQAHLITAGRPGFNLSEAQDRAFRGRVSRMEIPQLAISSSDIRRRIAEGRTIRYLVPAEVSAFIQQRGLYRADGRRRLD